MIGVWAPLLALTLAAGATALALSRQSLRFARRRRSPAGGAARRVTEGEALCAAESDWFASPDSAASTTL